MVYENKKEIPKSIFLQWKDDFDSPLEEITWCEDKIYSNDIEYIIKENG